MVAKSFGACGAALALTVALTGLTGSATSQSGSPDRTKAPEIREALAAGGLHAAAQASGGHYRQMIHSHFDMALEDFDALAKITDVAVIGQILDNRSHVGRDGRSLTTDFKVQVLEIVGGPAAGRSLEEIILSMAGGRVEFGDGTSAELRARGVVMPRSGARYLLFLRTVQGQLSDGQLSWREGTQGVFEPAGGPVGVYELGSDDRVKPASSKADPIIKKARMKAAKDLVRAAAKALTDAAKSQN